MVGWEKGDIGIGTTDPIAYVHFCTSTVAARVADIEVHPFPFTKLFLSGGGPHLLFAAVKGTGQLHCGQQGEEEEGHSKEGGHHCTH